MTHSTLRAQSGPHWHNGFTLLEVLLVVAIIGVLSLVAMPQYKRYAARSQAAELALQYDAVRTGIQIAAKSGEGQGACAALNSAVPPANLQSRYARLGVDFEPVTGGFTPVLTLCASVADQGLHAVDVTREAHHLLSRTSVIGPGAVIGDSAVSFSVRLAGESPLCKVLAPVGSNQAPCGANTTQSGPANTPLATVSSPVSTAVSAPVSTPGTANIPAAKASEPIPATVSTPQSNANACPQSPSGPVERPAMRFTGNGRITNNQNLNTQGDLREFTAEVVITGDARSGSSSALLSYSSGRPYSGFSIWNPGALYLEIGSMNYPTDLNMADGRPHRLTVSWKQSGGTLVLYDNGREVWRANGVNTGGTVGGNGRLTIGQADRSAEWGPGSFVDGYTGTIIHAALSTKAVSAAQVASGPLHNVFQAGSGLVTDVVMGANGKPQDLTGRTSYTAIGGVSAQSATVDSSIYRLRDCP